MRCVTAPTAPLTLLNSVNVTDTQYLRKTPRAIQTCNHHQTNTSP